MAKKAKSSEFEVAVLNCQYHMHLPTHFSYNGTEYSLYKGENYDLPKCDFVDQLIRQGRLTVNNISSSSTDTNV